MLVSAVMSPTFANSYEALLFYPSYTSYTLNIHEDLRGRTHEL